MLTVLSYFTDVSTVLHGVFSEICTFSIAKYNHKPSGSASCQAGNDVYIEGAFRPLQCVFAKVFAAQYLRTSVKQCADSTYRQSQRPVKPDYRHRIRADEICDPAVLL